MINARLFREFPMKIYTMPVRRCRWLVAGSLLLSVISLARGQQTPQTSPSTATALSAPVTPSKPSVTAPKVDSGIKAMQEAISTLSREYTAWRKNTQVGKLREASNYFQDNPSTDITAKHILNALHQQTMSDGIGDAYVKWQLLSGLPAKVDSSLAADLLNVYSQTPRYPSHPGLNKRELDQRVMKIKEDVADKLNDVFQTTITDWKGQFGPLLQYRNELFAHLPVSRQVLWAALSDFQARIAAGVPCSSLWPNFTGAIDVWTAEDKTTPNDIRQLADALKKLETYAADGKNQPYEKAEFDAKAKHMKWDAAGVLDNGQVDATLKQLKKLVDNPEPKLQIRKDN